MKSAIILQARMTSSRLPGKILMDLAGRPMLARQIERLKRCRCVDEIVIATTTNTTDDPVVDLARAEDVGCFRGNEHDVLGRYLGATNASGADVIVRITGDCPFIDADVLDTIVQTLIDPRAESKLTSGCDYASNVVARTYPRGLDAEALFADTLFRVGRLAQSRAAREHVTYFINTERRDLFICRDVKDTKDNSDLRWTVDTPEDLATIRRIFTGMGLGEQHRRYREILEWVRQRPDLTMSNQHVEQKRD